MIQNLSGRCLTTDLTLRWMGLYFFLVAAKASLMFVAGSLLSMCSCLSVIIEVLVDEILKSEKAWTMLWIVVFFVFTGALSAEEPNCARELIKYSPLFEMLHLISALLLLFGPSAVKNPAHALNTVAVWRTWV